MAGKTKKQDVSQILAQHRREQEIAKEMLEHPENLPEHLVEKITILAEAVLK